MTTIQDIKSAGERIRKGEIVAFPTETVYGLGADAFNPKAVSKIFEIKERPSFDPLIVHISRLEQLDMLCKKVDKTMLLLAEKFWPGPLTMVVEKSHLVPDIVTSGLNTVGIRMPAHPVAVELINEASTPIAAPSANKFGMVSPTEPWHIKRNLPGVNCILDGGKSTVGIESTVIRVVNGGFAMLRPGAVTLRALEKVLPQMEYLHAQGEKKVSPGLLKSHYSPQKPMFFSTDVNDLCDFSNAGLIAFGDSNKVNKFKHVEVLCNNNNLPDAAVNLFSCIHNMELADVDFIIVDPVPETGIGIAIMDRLKKAVFKHKTSQKYYDIKIK